MEILILVVWLVLGGVAAYIAGNKGRNGVGVFFLSVLLSPLVGLIVAFALSPNAEKVALAQGKKKCPNCAEYVQPDAKTCRFCQHSFVEEEAAEQQRLDAENAEKRTAAARQHAEWEAKQAAKPWVRRNPAPIFGVLILCFVSVAMWYGITHPPQRSQKTSTANDKPPVPAWAAEQRSKFPQSVWDKRVAWATQHHCYLGGMTREEIVRALGQPGEETSYDLKYKRQTKDCVRYAGDTCAEHKTEEQYIWLKDGYGIGGFNATPEQSYDQTCHTLYGEHEYLGIDVPSFTPAKAARKSVTSEKALDSGLHAQ